MKEPVARRDNIQYYMTNGDNGNNIICIIKTDED